MRLGLMICAVVALVSTVNADRIILDDVMDRETQYKTGVDKLNRNQKAALEAWLNKNFNLKVAAAKLKKFYLSENFQGGRKIGLTDGSIYEVSPDDITISSAWLTPIPIQISASGDVMFPVLLTNTISGSSVKARVSTLEDNNELNEMQQAPSGQVTPPVTN